MKTRQSPDPMSASDEREDASERSHMEWTLRGERFGLNADESITVVPIAERDKALEQVGRLRTALDEILGQACGGTKVWIRNRARQALASEGR